MFDNISPAFETVVALILGPFAMFTGLIMMRPAHQRQQAKIKLKSSRGLTQEDVDFLYFPMENKAFDIFSIWTGVAVFSLGLGIFVLFIPSQAIRTLAIGLMALAFGQAFFVTGLQMFFTGKAYVCSRRIGWVNPKTWRPGAWTEIEILWTRLFGLVPLAIGGVITLGWCHFVFGIAGLTLPAWPFS